MKKRILLMISCLMLLLCSCQTVQEGASDINDKTSSLIKDTLDKTGLSQVPETEAEPEPELDVPEDSLYYYSLHTEEEQNVYRQIYHAFRDREEKKHLSTLDPELVEHLIQDVMLDNPELFYTEHGQYTRYTRNDVLTAIDFTPLYTMGPAEQQEAQEAIDAYVSDFYTTLKEDMTDWQRALAAYEYVILHAEYVDNAPYNQTMYSAVLGETVCKGYASMLQYLLYDMDIPCIMVSGVASSGESHAWLMLYLDGEWCNADPTYGDQTLLQTDVDYSWFGLSGDFLENSRTTDCPHELPEAHSNANEFYVHRGRSFDSYSLSDILEIADGRSFFSFRYNNEEAYEEACTHLFGDGYQEVYEIPGFSSGSYIADPETRTIYIQYHSLISTGKPVGLYDNPE